MVEAVTTNVFVKFENLKKIFCFCRINIEIFTPWDLEIHATKSSTLIINVGTKIMDIFKLD